MEKIETFKRCLSGISYSRAGWDYQMPAAQRAEENRHGVAALDEAREIWAGSPERHDELRAAFNEARPLATMAEIERTAGSKGSAP